MKLQSALKLIQAKPMYIYDPAILWRDYTYAAATDLMSDALAMICTNCNRTILLTGLANAQSLRTAEMLDITTIIYVRNKRLSDDNLELAIEMEMNVFTTPLPMFEAIGILYREGFKTATRHDDSPL